MGDEEQDGKPDPVIRFPQSRVRPPGSGEARELGFGKMVEAFGLSHDQLTGHWCSRCVGIWYGAKLEVACPNCGNRHG